MNKTELQESSTKVKDLYFNSIDFKAIELTNMIVKELKKDSNFNLLSYQLQNAVNRNDKTKRIDNCIGNFFSYTLNGYHCYIELSDFWIFKGANISINKINKNNTYNRKHYLYKFKNVENNIQELITLLADPEKIYNKQEYISINSKEDKQYTNYNVKIESKIYY